MAEVHKPIEPVKPVGIDVVITYLCPHCGQRNQLLNPVQAAVTTCSECKGKFPVLPLDVCTVRYLKIMLDGGRAAVDPDFL